MVGLNALGQEEHDTDEQVNMLMMPPHVHHEKSSNTCVKSNLAFVEGRKKHPDCDRVGFTDHWKNLNL